MSTLSDSLRIGSSALKATQILLQTIANNVSNAERTDYSRQTVDLAATYSESYSYGQVGTGVTVEGVSRIRDQFLDQQYYKAATTLGEQTVRQGVLSRVETLLGATSDTTGLSSALSDFFAALQDLTTYPEDSTTRQTVLEQADVLATEVQSLRSGLTDITEEVELEISQRVSDINDLVDQVATLNGQIQTITASGGSANDLQDSRDAALDSLSGLVGITVLAQGDGTVLVSLAGGAGTLVSGTTGQHLSVEPFDSASDVDLKLGGASVTVEGGELAGLISCRDDSDGALQSTIADLDSLAAALIQGMNELQASGAGSSGLSSVTSEATLSSTSTPLVTADLLSSVEAGQVTVFTYDASSDSVTGQGVVTITNTTTLSDLATQLGGISGLTANITNGQLTITADSGTTFRFADDTSGVLTALGLNTFFTGSDAATIAVNSALTEDPTLLSTGLADSTTGVVSSGDNTVALEMAALSESELLDSGTATLSDFYAATVGSVGTQAAATNSQVETQELVVSAIETQRQSVSGVSLDEEMTNLIQAQRAYQAAAQVIQAVDELLQTVVNLV